MKCTILENVTIPEYRMAGYPEVRNLKVGDAAVYDFAEELMHGGETHKIIAKVGNAASKIGKEMGRKFRTRGDRPGKKVTIYRIS